MLPRKGLKNVSEECFGRFHSPFVAALHISSLIEDINQVTFSDSYVAESLIIIII